ncbi:MAG: hypothetical protein ACJAVO_002518 [Parvibaculaceae bacterium]|jgi:hypothetical protein
MSHGLREEHLSSVNTSCDGSVRLENDGTNFWLPKFIWQQGIPKALLKVEEV